MSSDLTPNEAAWEFLRRNRQYRADYAAYCELAALFDAKYGGARSWKEQAFQHEPRAWHYEPLKSPGESDDAWRVRAICEGSEPRKALLHRGYGRKWGLSEIVNPFQPLPNGVHFVLEISPPVWHRVDDIEADTDPACEDEINSAPAVFYTRLDASKSLTKQLATLRKTLVAHQRQLKSYGLRWRTALHADKWPLYLRIFDAYQAGATAKEVARAEFPHIANQFPEYAGQARARATYEQALALVKGGYRRIAFANC